MPLSLSTRWFQQGPYPAGMREQPFGPDLCFLAECGSAYTASDPTARSIDSGQVRVVHGDDREDAATHAVTLAYEDIDWEGPRATAGWAALQWQAMAWTTLDICDEGGSLVAVNLSGAAEFAIVDQSRQDPAPFQWYRGDYYSYAMGADGPPRDALHAPVPHLIRLAQGTYYFLVKALYEVRVFGAPSAGPPSATFTMQVAICDHERPSIVMRKPLLVCPDVFQGRLASLGPKDAGCPISIGVRNASSGRILHVTGICCMNCDAAVSLVTKNLVIQPQTTSQVTFSVKAGDTFEGVSGLLLALNVVSKQASSDSSFAENSSRLHFALPLNHVEADAPFALTYLVGQTAQLAVAKPPRNGSDAGNRFQNVILALHGAGVDAQDPFWVSSIPRQKDAWILMPTGLTPWGLDWQQKSCAAWKVLVDGWLSQHVPHRSQCKIFIVGHSNGGQGAWYAMSHYRDLFRGGVVGAGYIKLEEYVGFQWRDLRHTADASLVGILDSALSVYCNDLYASNLVGLPLLVKYGAADDNVPPWHSRAMRNLLCHWNALSGIPRVQWPRLVEVPGKGHWWDSFLREDDVQDMLRHAFEGTEVVEPPNKFTVTCVIPQETGPVFGWRIAQTSIPGRVSRLAVQYVEEAQGLCVRVDTRNVQAFSVGRSNGASAQQRCLRGASVSIDGSEVVTDLSVAEDCDSSTWFTRTGQQQWTVSSTAPPPLRPLWPISLLLSALDPIIVVVPDSPAYASIARRWSQDLLLYNAIPTRIVSEDEAIQAHLFNDLSETRVVLGGPYENRFVRALQAIAEEQRPVKPFIRHLSSSQFKVRDRIFAGAGIALLYIIESPGGGSGSANGNGSGSAHWSRNLVLSGTDLSGIERAGRLLPVRTGTPLPEWIVVGAEADRFGGGGVLAAGWYDNDWGYSEAMSYLAD